MTTMPTPRTDIVAQTLDYLYAQFHGAPVLGGYVASYAVQAQEIETLFVSLIVLRALPYATGAQLDVLGRIVGVGRAGMTDNQYRTAIGAQIYGIRSDGTVDSIEGLIAAASLGDHEAIIKYATQTSFVCDLGDRHTATDYAASFDALLQQFKGAGIRADLKYSKTDEAETLMFAEGDTAVGDVYRGLANDAVTDGGSLADTSRS